MQKEKSVFIGQTSRLHPDKVTANCSEHSYWVEIELSSDELSPPIAIELANLIAEGAKRAGELSLKDDEEDMDKSNEQYTDFALHLREIIREEIDAAVFRHVKPYSS